LLGNAQKYKCVSCDFEYVESDGRAYENQYIPIYIKHYYDVWPTNCIHKFENMGFIYYESSVPKIIYIVIRYNWLFILLSIAGVLLIIFQKVKTYSLWLKFLNFIHDITKKTTDKLHWHFLIILALIFTAVFFVLQLVAAYYLSYYNAGVNFKFTCSKCNRVISKTYGTYVKGQYIPFEYLPFSPENVISQGNSKCSHELVNSGITEHDIYVRREIIWIIVISRASAGLVLLLALLILCKLYIKYSKANTIINKPSM
jgi:hypothetical protein